MDYTQLLQSVKDKQIVAAINTQGKRERFFISRFGSLCTFNPRSRRYGTEVHYSDLGRFVEYIGVKQATPKDELQEKYKLIAKYKKLAQSASFTNSFIRSCRELPSFEDWLVDLNEDGKHKTLFDYGITTGNRIDGKVITLNRIAKQYPDAINGLRKAIHTWVTTKETVKFLYRYPFAGYEATLETFQNNGEFMCSLSLEFANCANGYYYLLINDENFIGYDID